MSGNRELSATGPPSARVSNSGHLDEQKNLNAKFERAERKAGRSLPRLRRLLTAADAPIEPSRQPPDFEAEGKAIAAALSWVLLKHANRLNRLERFFVYFRQAMEAPYHAEAQACAKKGVETLLKVPRPPASRMEELRALSRSDGKELDAIESRVPKVTGSAAGP